MQNAENKSKKFVVLATYVVAVLCLLAGLFLPLFNGKDMLALKLLDVFKSLFGKTADPNPFELEYRISLFGIQKLSFDFMALVIAVYVIITAFALLSFIPVILSVRKEGKLAKKFYYGIEAAAIIVLSLFFVIVLQIEWVKCYNMVIAICGTVVALLVLSGMDKGKAAVIKIVLFLLSIIGFLALFDFVILLSKLAEFEAFTTKVSSALVNDINGANYLTLLFTTKLSDVFAEDPVKIQALNAFGMMTATVVLLNFFIDTVRLCTGKDGKVKHIFNISRYGLEVVTALCLLITALICKKDGAVIGLMLIAILVVAVVQLAIVTVRFVMSILKKPDNVRVEDGDEENAVEDETVPELKAEDQPVEAEPFNTEEYSEEANPLNDGYTSDGYDGADDDGYVSPDDDKYNEQNDEDYISPDELPAEEPTQEPVEEPAKEEITEEAKPAEEEITDYEIKTDGTYLLPADETIAEEPAEEVEEKVEEPAQEEVAEEPATEVPVAEEPAIEEPAEEVEEKVEEPDTTQEENAQRYKEEIKPYNPYERHNNPFRAYEQSSQPIQPYNPYQPVAKQPEKPVQPARPVYEQKPEQKPVHTYKPYESATERPQTVRPLQPRPIIQEFKPVPPINEKPPKERQVYTIDAIYAGPVDDFIRKLSNDERIEFAKTFIEKNRGDLGNIPDYVVGGDNKKFFSISFIYLGRIRGLVSDGLLNKMYKELNML